MYFLFTFSLTLLLKLYSTPSLSKLPFDIKYNWQRKWVIKKVKIGFLCNVMYQNVLYVYLITLKKNL